VLFEMLTGRRLREITDDVEGWRQVASGLVPPVRSFRPDLPPALERVLSGALAPDPRDRFPDARAFVAAAREALATVARSATSEETELQDLLKSVLPPGTPRQPGAPSKVIRLVSEFLPPDQTVRARAPGIALQALAAELSDEPAEHPHHNGAGQPRAEGTQFFEHPGVFDGAEGLDDPAASPTASTIAEETPFAVETAGDGWSAPLPGPHWPGRGATLLFLLALLPGLASLIHYFVIPLPVLLSWSAPARLDVVSEPAGATVWLDGRQLSAPTPTYTEVSRDRRTHFVEVRRDGFQAARRPIRFDSAEILSLTFTMQPESRPSFTPMPEVSRPEENAPAR
jgi:hypothetical protein